MKYLIINGSPHKGNTWKLAELAQAQIEADFPDAEFEELHLSALDLPFCTGCSLCFRKGHEHCPHSGATLDIINKIESCGGLIFTFTTFLMQPNALAKNFIDHLCFTLHRPRFFKTKALIITTTGGVGASKAAKYVSGSLMSMGFNRCYRLAAVSASWNDYTPSEKTSRRCRKLAAEFSGDVESGRLRPPGYVSLMTYNLFRGMSLAYAPGSSYETEDGKHWTDPSRARLAYDPAVKTPLHKAAFGGIFFYIGKLGGKFITVTYKK